MNNYRLHQFIKKKETIFIIVFILSFLAIAISTLSDYGLTYDEAEFYFGDKYFYFLKERNPDYLLFEKDNIDLYHRDDHPDFYFFSSFIKQNPHHVWPVGVTASSFTKYIFFTKLGLLDPIDAHHLIVPVAVAVLLIILYYFTLHQFGFWPACISILCLIIHPRFWSHLHHNTKDVPITLMFAIVIILFYYGITERKHKLILLSSVFWGIGLATKANAVFIPIILLPCLISVIHHRYKETESLASRSELISLSFFPIIGLFLMLICWPYLLIEFPENLIAHCQYLISRGGQGSPSWNEMPIIHAVTTMPISILFLFTVGVIIILRETVKRKRLTPLYMLLFLWITIPILRVSIPKAIDFDGIRHWLEFLPPTVIIAGIGGSFLLEQLSSLVAYNSKKSKSSNFRQLTKIGTIVLYFLPVIHWNIKNHPYQLAFFNKFIGGLKGAQERNLPQATDYWGSSYRKGIDWLNKNAEKDSMLLVGVGGHIVHITEKIWLRDDIINVRIALHPKTHEISPKLIDAIQHHSSSVYMMYITRKEHYFPYLEDFDQRLNPIFKIDVDGGTILKILSIKVKLI